MTDYTLYLENSFGVHECTIKSPTRIAVGRKLVYIEYNDDGMARTLAVGKHEYRYIGIEYDKWAEQMIDLTLVQRLDMTFPLKKDAEEE